MKQNNLFLDELKLNIFGYWVTGHLEITINADFNLGIKPSKVPK